MAQKTIDLEIDPGKTEARWIAVDNTDVPLHGNKGSASVDDSLPKHALTWWFTGDPGTTLKITGKVAGKTVVTVSSSIPDGEHDGGGRRRFTLTAIKDK